MWDCRIGGYQMLKKCQVLKKWLSYRGRSIIGRALSAEEVGHIRQTAPWIAAVLLLGPDLDASYRNCLLVAGTA